VSEVKSPTKRIAPNEIQSNTKTKRTKEKEKKKKRETERSRLCIEFDKYL